MNCKLVSLLAVSVLVVGSWNIQPAAAGAPSAEQMSPYDSRSKVRTYRRRHSHPHQHYRGGSYPPTVMKNGRAYFYYPGTGEQDSPAFRGEQHHTYKREGRFRLFGFIDRLRW